MVGEDALCCALGQKLVEAAMPGWALSRAPINSRGITRLLPGLPRYAEQAKHVQPVLCVADTDEKCPVDMRAKWMPKHAPSGLLFRLAVPEAESWVLADRVAFADFFCVPMNKLPMRPECLADAKAELLRLARISKIRHIREEVVSSENLERQGVGYNTHLCSLIQGPWNANRASELAPSLGRAVQRLSEFAVS